MALKIVIAGPKQTGKTCIVNFVTDQVEEFNSNTEYWPTAAVRYAYTSVRHTDTCRETGLFGM
jgi:Cdc6-like AAA superfamily ATPase